MEVNFKPISYIVKKAATQILPAKSRFLTSNLQPLSHDIVDLTPQKEFVKSYAAEKLKKFYRSKGVPFLLPHQEWSDQKISQTVKVLGKTLDRLTQAEVLNKKTLQDAINELVPKTKGKIIVKDFSDLRKDLEKAKVPPKDINVFLDSQALAHTETKKTTLYLKFENMIMGRGRETGLKCSIEHEFTHALNGRLKNGMLSDDFKNDAYKCVKQKDAFDLFFQKFEKHYGGDYPEWEMETTTENLLKCLGFDSTKHLHKHFEKTYNLLVASSTLRGELDIGSDTKSWKQFLNCMKNHALEEKSAYQSNVRYREVAENPAAPVSQELEPLLYDEMAKFFAQKRIEANHIFRSF